MEHRKVRKRKVYLKTKEKRLPARGCNHTDRPGPLGRDVKGRCRVHTCRRDSGSPSGRTQVCNLLFRSLGWDLYPPPPGLPPF